MTNQQKIGAIILIGLLVFGIIFKFYNPIASFVWLATVLCAIYTEIAKKQTANRPPTLEDIQKKYPKRKSSEQIRAEKLRQRQEAYDRDFANRMKARGIGQPSKGVRDSAKYKKLLSMLGGNRDTADRLISTYGIDKAISDLERDRRVN